LKVSIPIRTEIDTVSADVIRVWLGSGMNLAELRKAVSIALQAMTNDSDLNMGNNIGKRDTQFFGMFWLKTLEN
jgi:hypothetical protein